MNTDTGEKVGQIKIDSNRLEAMVVEKSGSRLFLNMTEKNSIGVIDRKKQAVAAVWPLSGCKVNASVAIDEKNHRLFAACRDGNMNVLDSDTGKVLQNLPISTGVDDMVFDPASQRVYVATGEGFVNVFKEIDPDHFQGDRESSHWSAGQDRAVGAVIEGVFCGRAAARSQVRGGNGFRGAVRRLRELFPALNTNVGSDGSVEPKISLRRQFRFRRFLRISGNGRCRRTRSRILRPRVRRTCRSSWLRGSLPLP